MSQIILISPTTYPLSSPTPYLGSYAPILFQQSTRTIRLTTWPPPSNPTITSISHQPSPPASINHHHTTLQKPSPPRFTKQHPKCLTKCLTESLTHVYYSHLPTWYQLWRCIVTVVFSDGPQTRE